MVWMYPLFCSSEAISNWLPFYIDTNTWMTAGIRVKSTRFELIALTTV